LLLLIEIEICHGYDNNNSPMKVEELTNSVVRAVVTAMRDGDRKSFFASFEQSVILTDDGHQQPFADWADREIFLAHGRLDVKQQNRNGLELVGPFHSDQWDMETVWRFEIADGHVRPLMWLPCETGQQPSN
jgi:hypothetical protein